MAGSHFGGQRSLLRLLEAFKEALRGKTVAKDGPRAVPARHCGGFGNQNFGD